MVAAARFVPVSMREFMMNSRFGTTAARWGLNLAFALLVAGITSVAGAVEQTLPLLKTKTATYTNVTVTTKSADYVFIMYAAGMANIKTQDLLPETMRELGYVVPEDKHSQPVMVMARQLVPELQARFKLFEEKWHSAIPWSREQLHLSSKMIYGLAGGAVILYLFCSYCCHLICIKSKKAPSFLVWLPVLKWIPLLRAAEMSAWWLLSFFLPVAPIVWTFKIAKARGMGLWIPIFLILPVTSPLAFLYLAFAREAPAPDGAKYRSMALQTD